MKNLQLLILIFLIPTFLFGQSEKDYEKEGRKHILYGKYNEAKKCFDSAIKVNPQNSFTYVQRSSAKRFLEDFSGALDDLNKAIKLDSQKASYYHARFQVKKTLEDIKGATEDLNKAIELNPRKLNYYSERVDLYIELNRYSKALQDINKKLELAPSSGYTYISRAELNYKHLNKSSEICDDVAKAKELGVSDTLISPSLIKFCK